MGAAPSIQSSGPFDSLHPSPWRSPVSTALSRSGVFPSSRAAVERGDSAVPGLAAPLAHLTVGFAPPMLSLIAGGIKTLDMRPIDDPSTRRLRVGDVFIGHQRSSPPVPIRVVTVACFPSVRDAFAHYYHLDLHHRLFPPSSCLQWGRAITTSVAADAHYRQLRRSADDPGPVRILGVCPLHWHAASPSVAPGTVAPHAASPAPSPIAPSPPRPPPGLPTPCLHPVAPPRRRLRSCAPVPPPNHQLPYLPLTRHAATVAADATSDAGVADLIVSDARRAARARGSAAVSAREIRDAAARHMGLPDPSVSPAAVEPENIDDVVDALARCKAAASSLSGGGSRRVRVLVVGERNAVVARAFRDAGADVATCDLEESKDTSIPHYKGDAVDIQDLGWDLVVAHPPCTYLANSGLCWLHRDPERWSHVVNNAAVFRTMYKAKAPFVAVENSKMHRYGRALVGVGPTQYVHPWQHGTGHTKPTALYLQNLPPLKPTHIVTGREHALAQLPPSEDRSEHRSHTYLGIAAAMAVQWMPVLLEYATNHPEDSPHTAPALVQRASATTTQRHAQVIFYRRSSDGQSEIVTCEIPSVPYPTLPTLDLDNEAASTFLRRWAAHGVLLPHDWLTSLESALDYFPDGHGATTHAIDAVQHRHHLWAVDVSGCSDALPISRDPDDSTTYAWGLLSQVRADFLRSSGDVHDYLLTLADAVQTVSTFAPLDPPSPRLAAPVLRDATEFATATPKPISSRRPASPRHASRRHGSWRVWAGSSTSPEEATSYGWHRLPESLSSNIDQYISHSAQSPMPAVSEVAADTDWLPKTRDERVSAPAAGPSLRKLLQHPARALWDQRPRPRSAPNLGVGATLDTPPRFRLSSTAKSQQAKAAAYRADHALWCQPTSDSYDPVIDVPAVDERYNRWLRSASGQSLPESATAATVAAVIPESAFALTPHDPFAEAKHALFVSDLKVLRFRNKERTEYHVNAAYAVPRSLTDTGAGPSIATTGLLAELPPDACLDRDPDAAVHPVNGPDGRPLRTHGTARLSFLMGGCPCRHDFLVVEGAPLLLLGNDFLAPRKAAITYADSQHGELSLSSISDTGRTIKHSVAVTTSPPRVSAAVVPVVPPAIVASATVVPSSVEPGTQPPPPDPSTLPPMGLPKDPPEVTKTEPLPSPPTPEQSITEAVAAGAWELHQTEHLLYSQHPIRLPPRSVVTALVSAPQALLDLIREGQHPSCLVDRLPNRPGLEEPPQVVPRCAAIENGKIEVQIVNTRRTAHTIAATSPLALIDSEYYVRGQAVTPSAAGDSPDWVSALSPEQTELLDSVEIDPQKRLSPDQREQVRQLVARNIDAFALDPKCPSKTHLLTVELPLKPGAVAHNHGASRLGEVGNDIVDKHVAEMESRGIIRKSNSEWGSRVVLVTKKDGSIRFCVDYRDLNSKLQTLDSPIPLTVEAIDRLSSGTGSQSSLFLCTLDLASGFWCLPIRESDKGLTTFVTRRQKYEFNYLPFGVQSGPSYMCRLMDAALQGLAWETCMPYLDDVGVWSTGVGDTPEKREADSFDQMITRLGNVFERLRWAGLSMKASKCTLFATQAEYLGHVISREGLRMDPKKISTVDAIDPKSINTLEKVRSFLGLCSYYRRFIAGFSRIAAPLSDLTKAGVDVALQSQTAACQEAIVALKHAITSEPVLGTPRYDRPFIVKTDAANTEGLGGVLAQLDDDGKERPIAYYGRRLKEKGERGYTVTEIEMLAAIESIKHWRPYLWGRKFKLVVDHQALRWLHTMRDTMEGGPASRVMRWILSLQEYNFDVEYKPGALHKDADGISRLASAATRARVTTARTLQAENRQPTSKHEVSRSYLAPGMPNLDAIRDEQRDDPEARAIRQYLEVGHAVDPVDSDALRRAAWLAKEVCPTEDGRIVRRIVVIDDVLHRQTSRGKHVPYVPHSLRQPIIAAFHDHMGHPSASRVTSLIRRRFYWPNLASDAALHVSECHECTLSKPGVRPRRSVGPTVGQYPFDVCFADICDMADTHDYDPASGAGHRKLLVFVDSLTRWVEAIPLHKDPSSEQVLDLFLEHVVSRHGAPRRVISDSGSNLSSRLCDAIMDSCGVDLRPTAADHHEAAGTVERFQSTLVNMARASDEGGRYWADHLPFLLLSYRSTPHRVTSESPAALLYGRELRLPPEMVAGSEPDGIAASAASGSKSSKDAREAIRAYALRLHLRLAYAWQAARDATLDGQSRTIQDAELRTKGGHAIPNTYVVGDRVVRYLHDNPNKLQYVYAGPYRVTADLGDGRYQLRDLENGHVQPDVNASNLRPYHTHVDAETLQDDEYLVDRLLDRRGRGAATQYLVKWRGYPRSRATWEFRTELTRRCQELLDKYDSDHQRRQRASLPPVAASPPAAPPAAAPPAVPAPTPPVPTHSGHLPHVAKFERGQWLYGRTTTSPRGSRTRFLPSANYTAPELASDHFVALRQSASAVLYADPDVAAVFHALSNPYHLSSVWFSTLRATGPQLLCGLPLAGRPSAITPFRCGQAVSDNGSAGTCALRCVRERAKLPGAWKEDLHLALASDPDGHHSDDRSGSPASLWHVPIATSRSHLVASLTAAGCDYFRSDSFSWRPAVDVLLALDPSDAVPLAELLAVTYPTAAADLRSAASREATALAPPRLPPRRPVTPEEYHRALASGDEVTLSHACSQGMTAPPFEGDPSPNSSFPYTCDET